MATMHGEHDPGDEDRSEPSAFDAAWELEFADAEVRARKDDELMAAACRGEPFWRTGAVPASIEGLGVFFIEPDPPDLAERRAKRVAEHQAAEVARLRGGR